MAVIVSKDDALSWGPQLGTYSTELFERAQRHIPGGVNSPVRSFKGVEGRPLFFSSGTGAYITDVDDKSYIDYVCSWGALILGHADPRTVEAVQQAVSKGLSYGAPTEIELQLAEKICQLMPSIEMIRMVNSGTEATMSAIRLARGYTERQKILKFNGCYHGHSDALLANAGSGALTLGLLNSAGIPQSVAQDVITVEFNELKQVEQAFARDGHAIAAVIVEPVAGNMSCILPVPGFLEGLRELCTRYESLLIFDEVMTGFRVALGGAQSCYHVEPDLTTLGKIIGGGLPVGAVGGRETIMRKMAPLGPVYQAGTLSGNPIVMQAGLVTLEKISQPGFYDQLTQTTAMLMDGLLACAKAAGISLRVHHRGGMFGFFFSENEVSNYEQVKRCNLKQFKQFFHGMLNEGVYLAPSMYEAGFMSSAHGELEVEKTLQAAKRVLKAI